MQPMMSSFTSWDGLRIAYQVWGERSVLPPVVLHHGFVADADSNWVAIGVVERLQAAGRQVIAPDARGHGRSEKPHEPERYGESSMARDLAALVELLGLGEIDLVGYSMGAIVSLLYASEHETVRRLVIGGVGSGVIECGGVDRRAVSNEAILAALRVEEESELQALQPEAAAFRRLADATGADRLALLAQASSIHRAGVALDRITAPTLLLAGAEDPLALRPQMLIEAIPGARLELLAGNHISALGDPRFAEAIVEFLAG
jgi:pimeloyl-ACP methyl ester carboxylesterase